jgi:tetratricopeptide (TPR) repeat protein
VTRALACAVLVLAASSARADELRPEQIPPRARALAEQGRAYHDAGDYAHAIRAFEEAYALAPSPTLLFDLAQAYRLSGECDEAAWMYRRYLGSEPSGDGRVLAESHLQQVERCSHPFPVPRFVATKAVEAHDTAVTALATMPPAAPPRSARIEREAGGALVAGGTVLLVTAGYFALEAEDASDSVSGVYKDGGKGTEVAQLAADGQRAETYATWLGITGAVATAGGVALYWHGHHVESAYRFAAAPTLHGAGVVWSGRF